jgi:hypothetical protein
MKGNVFYSWQSDLPNKTNRGFIQDALERAAEDLKKDNEIIIEPVIDRDTAGVPGSPDIGLTIFAKIDEAVAFVCDVSFVTADSAGRPSPNPNVLIELGYALKALGVGKTLMVMNTVFGPPDKLPFDLKQKRVVPYELRDGEDKAAARKYLRERLGKELKEIIKGHQESIARAQASAPALADAVIEAIRLNRADQGSLVKRLMQWLAEEVKNVDSHSAPGEPDENLVQAIDKTVPLVHEFSRVSEVIAAMNSWEAARATFRGMEHVLALYSYRPAAGYFRETDFDLFKFVGHELCVTLFAHLLSEERWSIIKGLLQETIHREDGPRGPERVGFCRLSAHVALLDDIRTRRLQDQRSRRISFHADILKARHESGPLAKDTPWDQFREADALLFFAGYGARVATGVGWWPRTAVYLESLRPRFLIAATAAEGAKALADALGEPDLASSKKRIREAIMRLGEGVTQMGSTIFDLFAGFDPERLAE